MKVDKTYIEGVIKPKPEATSTWSREETSRHSLEVLMLF